MGNEGFYTAAAVYTNIKQHLFMCFVNVSGEIVLFSKGGATHPGLGPGVAETLHLPFDALAVLVDADVAGHSVPALGGDHPHQGLLSLSGKSSPHAALQDCWCLATLPLYLDPVLPRLVIVTVVTTLDVPCRIR